MVSAWNRSTSAKATVRQPETPAGRTATRVAPTTVQPSPYRESAVRSAGTA